MRLSFLGWGACNRPRVVTYAVGVSVISVWTLLRFFTKRTIFDLVSQQVIVQQWLHGHISPAHMGQTAYVPKMLLLYAPLDILLGSPRLKLILLTLAINAATFILLGLIAERILREYHVRVGWTFYAALVWLSVIAGSVFWIQFTNSRNLEIVGGVLLLYLGLRYLRQPSRRSSILVAAFGSLLFFSDPLQVYMTALALVVYAGSLALLKREKTQHAIMLAGLLVVAYAGSKLLFVATGHWLQLSFTDTGTVIAPQLSAHWLLQNTVGSVKAIVSLLIGANDAGRLREVGNLGLLVLGLAAITYGTVRKFISYRLLLLVGSICATDVLVYVASGQAIQGATTSRYLIMTVPALLLAGSAIRLPKFTHTPALVIVGAILLFNIVMLTATLGKHWNTSFPKDAHIASVYRYIQKNPGLHVYASTDTAMALLYLKGLPATTSLPVGCLGSELVRTHFSMDQDFAQAAVSSKDTTAIIFDGTTIANTPNVCTVPAIDSQFGTPQVIDHTDDGSIVLRYTRSALRLPG
jgi:hypothetical protein